MRGLTRRIALALTVWLWVPGVALGQSSGWCVTTNTVASGLCPPPPPGQAPATTCCIDVCDAPDTRDAWIPPSGATKLTVRVKIHVLSDEADQGDVSEEISTLNLDYDASSIDFSVQSEFLTSSPFWNAPVTSVPDADPIKQAHAESPLTQLNVYVVNMQWPGVYAWSTFPWDPNATKALGGIVIDAMAFGTGPGKVERILTHEIGHALGLWHTFHGSVEFQELDSHGGCASETDACTCACYERANRTDAQGDTLGDMCGDTPGSPSLQGCVAPSFGDPCSPEDWLQVVDHNHMATKFPDRTCPNGFTSQQKGRMHCWTCDKLPRWAVGWTKSGGCCLPDGTCESTNRPCCENRGGTFLGVNATCPGGGPPGVCCLPPGGQCAMMSQACCTQANGIFHPTGSCPFTCESQQGPGYGP